VVSNYVSVHRTYTPLEVSDKEEARRGAPEVTSTILEKTSDIRSTLIFAFQIPDGDPGREDGPFLSEHIFEILTPVNWTFGLWSNMEKGRDQRGCVGRDLRMRSEKSLASPAACATSSM